MVARPCQDVRYHKGWHSAECRERARPATVLDTMWPVGMTKRLLLVLAMHVETTRRSDAKMMQRTKLQEPSSGSSVKCSAADIEAIRRADAEAEKALKRARLLDERRAGK